MKGADQLRGYREADLRLCFRLCKLLFFSCTGSNFSDYTDLCLKIVFETIQCNKGNITPHLCYSTDLSGLYFIMSIFWSAGLCQ